VLQQKRELCLHKVSITGKFYPIHDILSQSVSYTLKKTSESHIPGVVALQRQCFPEPFPIEALWKTEHIQNHIKIFPAGQFVVTKNNEVVASCTNMLVSRESWEAHESWDNSTGGLSLQNHNPAGSVLHGIDISVHPAHRNRGLGKLLYNARFELVKTLSLIKYGTVCRIPDYRDSKCPSPDDFIKSVLDNRQSDRTLTPLLKMGLQFKGIIQNYMEDEESGNTGAILEWTP
jgi:GNAT superfamily N-acetyltransferase